MALDGSVAGPNHAVDKARDAGGAKNVLVIGAASARQCIQEGLIDQIRVYLAPLLLDDGVRFFSWPGTPDVVHLETIGRRAVRST
jgi:dihydrofolate reductase